jgi:hypothetical protein
MITTANTKISDTLGGGSVETLIVDALPCGRGYAIHHIEQASALPDNPRAAAIAARLGHTDRADQANLRGDILITGLIAGHEDEANVPPEILQAVQRTLVGLPGPRSHQSAARLRTSEAITQPNGLWWG